MSLRTPLGKVRGLGSAKAGVEHFWRQRATAAALVPLTIWFVWSIARLAGAPYADVIAFFGSPFNAVMMLLFVGAGLYHMALGLQVVIEDYVRSDALKLSLLLASKIAAFATAAACFIAVLRLAA